MTEVGHSFYPLPAYANGWVGYRWREPNEEVQRDFGDEGFFLAAGGRKLRGRWGFSAHCGRTDERYDPSHRESPLAERRALLPTAHAKVSYAIGPGMASLGTRIPLGGKTCLPDRR